MSVWSVSLPTASLTFEAPAVAQTVLRQFFPRATAAGGPEDGVHYAIALEGELWRLEENGAVVGRYAAPAHALAAVEHRCVELVARSASGSIAFHAGAVDVGGSACLLAGGAETGKSATTVQLLELGHVFLADEIAVVEIASDRVRPFHRTPALGAGFAADRFGAAEPVHGELVEPAPGITRYLPRRLGGEPVKVTSLLLPRFRPGAATEIAELTAEAALTEVLGYCFEPVGDPEWLVDALIGQLGRWPIRRLTYGDAAAARGALATLFAHPGGVGGEPA